MSYELSQKPNIHVEYRASRRYMDWGYITFVCSGVTCLFEATRIDWCVEDWVRSLRIETFLDLSVWFWSTHHALLLLPFFCSPHILKHDLSFGSYLRKNCCADILI